MRRTLTLSLILGLAGSAAAQPPAPQPAPRVVMSADEAGYQDLIMQDAALAGACIISKRDCDESARKSKDYSRDFGSVDANHADWQTLQNMSAALRQVTAANARCSQSTSVFNARLDLALGLGSAARLLRSFAFDDKVFVKLSVPAPRTSTAPRGDAEMLYQGISDP